jgi:hypothetical protein
MPRELAQLTLYCCSITSQRSRPNSTFVGSGIGLLAASAANLFSTTTAPVLLSVEIVRLSFRIGCHVDRVAYELSEQAEADQPWSYYVPGLDKHDAEQAISDARSTTLVGDLTMNHKEGSWLIVCRSPLS